MKKFLVLLTCILALSSNAKAESIVVIDQNGTVIRQMYTSPAYNQPAVVTTAPTQTVTVVRESPTVQNSYYYDAPSTSAAWAAGVTTAVVGGLLFNGFRIGHHHHHNHHYVAKPHHGGHGGGHHGGHRR